jgi:hypothetical protein
MSKFTRAALLLALSVLIIVATFLVASAWVWKDLWLQYLWLNVSHALHQEWFAVLLVALIYIAAFLLVRWNLIACPIRFDLFARISEVRLELDREPPGDSEKDRKILRLKAVLCEAAERVNRVGLLDQILWTRGQEVASWSEVDAVTCEVAFIQSAERVRARLMTSEQDLRGVSKDADALADLIHTELASDPSSPSHLSDEGYRWRLHEALGVIYSASDDEFDNTLNWHNKIIWLICAGILLLISLESVKRGGGGLFAAGAVGGFLGRLMRTLKRRNIDGDDYDAYWTTMFVSPLVGALAAWTGILLVELGVKLNVLGSTFNGVTLETGYGNFALGVAFLLGFSERFFVKILKPLEEEGTAEEENTTSSSSPSGPSSPSSPSTPLGSSDVGT